MSTEIPFLIPDRELGKVLSRLLMYLSDANTELPLTDQQIKHIVKGLRETHGHGSYIKKNSVKKE